MFECVTVSPDIYTLAVSDAVATKSFILQGGEATRERERDAFILHPG